MSNGAGSAEFTSWVVLALAAIFGGIGWILSSSAFVIVPMALFGTLLGLAIGWAFSLATRK